MPTALCAQSITSSRPSPRIEGVREGTQQQGTHMEYGSSRSIWGLMRKSICTSHTQICLSARPRHGPRLAPPQGRACAHPKSAAAKFTTRAAVRAAQPSSTGAFLGSFHAPSTGSASAWRRRGPRHRRRSRQRLQATANRPVTSVAPSCPVSPRAHGALAPRCATRAYLLVDGGVSSQSDDLPSANLFLFFCPVHSRHLLCFSSPSRHLSLGGDAGWWRPARRPV